MNNFLFVFVTVFLISSSCYAEDKFDFEKLGQKVEKYRDARNSLTLRNGREYTLDKGVITERFDVEGLQVKANFFDLENGIMIHDAGENEISTECLDMITPFSQLPERRIEEVTEIGCLLYDRKNRLTARNDALDDFNEKFCQVIE